MVQPAFWAAFSAQPSNVSKAEARGQEKANAREAMPHKEATPGSTPIDSA